MTTEPMTEEQFNSIANRLMNARVKAWEVAALVAEVRRLQAELASAREVIEWAAKHNALGGDYFPSEPFRDWLAQHGGTVKEEE